MPGNQRGHFKQGVERLHGGRHQIAADYLEIGSFISAAVTGGELLIKDVCHEDLRVILQIFARLGIEVLAQGNDLLVPAGQALEITHDLGGAIAKIDDAPWPGFPADLTSIALVTATQCRGTILIHEKMYESRLFFVDNLIAMGAKIIVRPAPRGGHRADQAARFPAYQPRYSGRQ